MPLRDFERKEIFEPLGMKDTSLGVGRAPIGETVQVQDSGDSAAYLPGGVTADGDGAGDGLSHGVAAPPD